MKGKFLLIGPLPQKGVPSSIGGATTLFKTLLTYCDKNSIKYETVVTNKFPGAKGILATLLSFLKKQRGCKIIFCNVSQNGAKLLIPFCYLIATILRKKLIFRSFGSWIDDSLKNSKIVRYTFQHADIAIVETYKLGNLLKSYQPNLFVLPNSRKRLVDNTIQRKEYRKKFAFIGHVKVNKGILNILKAFEELDNSFEVAIYGPIVDEKLDFLRVNPIYKGVLDGTSQVIEALLSHDVLLLPTFYDGEGHPGIIIEAYSMGVPVIASNWKSIPELLNEDETGYLSEPDDYKSLLLAILKINEHNYEVLSKNALKKFNEFDSDIVHKRLFKYIEEK